MTQQPDPSSKSGKILDTVLSYASTPWKAIIVLVAVLLGAICWAIWQERVALERYLLNRGSTVIHIEDIPNVLNGVIVQTDVDIATIWSLEYDRNKGYFLGGRKHDGENWDFFPKALAILQPNSRAEKMLQILSGQPACLDLPVPGEETILLHRLTIEGMTRACAIPIGVGVGVFIVAWRQKPEDRQEKTMIGILYDFSNTLLDK